MYTLFGRQSAAIYTLLRVVAGAAFSAHGAQKLLGAFGGFGGNPEATAPLLSLMGAAGLIELVGGILIAIGLFTAPAAFIASGEMAVAYFMAHAPQGFWPIQNQGELALIYAVLFLYMASHGPGPYSVDAALRQAGHADLTEGTPHPAHPRMSTR
jgi:putative oxidoreductase